MKLLTAKDVSAMLRLKERTIWKKARAGEIPCVMVGRNMRFREEDIKALVEPLPARIESVLDLCEDSIEEAELRAQLTEILNRAKTLKDRFLVKRHGQPIAALLPLEDLMLLETGEDMWLAEKVAKAPPEDGDPIPFAEVVKELGITLKEKAAV